MKNGSDFDSEIDQYTYSNYFVYEKNYNIKKKTREKDNFKTTENGWESKR